MNLHTTQGYNIQFPKNDYPPLNLYLYQYAQQNQTPDSHAMCIKPSFEGRDHLSKDRQIESVCLRLPDQILSYYGKLMLLQGSPIRYFPSFQDS